MATVESSGVAKAGLTTGIIGTSLAGLMALGNNNGWGGNGLLGGILGGNNNAGLASVAVLAEKDAEIAKLKAENYSDHVATSVYKQALADNKVLRDEMYAYITPIANEAASNRERVAVLETQVKCETEKALLREQLIEAKIDNCCCKTNAKIEAVAASSACGIAQLNNAVMGLQTSFANITKVVIPTTAICPEVMPRYNSYTAPTDTAPATQPVTGTVSAV